jgi:four helix bundle protein
MARGSCLEVQTQIETAKMLGFGIPEELEKAQEIAMEVVKILNASIATNKARIASKQN